VFQEKPNTPVAPGSVTTAYIAQAVQFVTLCGKVLLLYTATSPHRLKDYCRILYTC